METISAPCASILWSMFFTNSLPRKGMETIQQGFIQVYLMAALQTHCPARGWKLLFNPPIDLLVRFTNSLPRKGMETCQPQVAIRSPPIYLKTHSTATG